MSLSRIWMQVLHNSLNRYNMTRTGLTDAQHEPKCNLQCRYSTRNFYLLDSAKKNLHRKSSIRRQLCVFRACAGLS
jgi:hypothetical protein